MKRLVLLVEGEGDERAGPSLTQRVLNHLELEGELFIDGCPLKVGGLGRIEKDNFKHWKRWVGTAARRSNVGAVLALLDGDASKFCRESFCASQAASRLASEARAAGAGKTFSIAVVFACVEYESWLLAGIPSLAGKHLGDGRPGVVAEATPPSSDLERSPRDAKGYLDKIMVNGYREVQDQKLLTSLVDLQELRALRSFCRFERAVAELAEAVRNDRYIVTPALSGSAAEQAKDNQ